VADVGLAERKRALRVEMAARRLDVSRAEADLAARMAAAQLLSAPEFHRASRVALYAATDDELATRPVFEASRRAGKRCLFPRTGASRRLSFHPVGRWDELRPGRFGILEPPSGATGVELLPADLVLVPGLAFDSEGRRLGRGGGHYDGTFPPAAGPAPRLFGLAYEFQVVELVPHDSHDRRMDAIVTERTIRRIATRDAR
jgi:5-formyltetrahydrofolate cyclo-ligase